LEKEQIAFKKAKFLIKKWKFFWKMGVKNSKLSAIIASVHYKPWKK